MRKNSFLTFLREKSFIVVLALLLVSAATMVALFSVGGEDPTAENQVAAEDATKNTASAVKENITNAKPTEDTAETTIIPKASIIPKTTDTQEKKTESTPDTTQAELEDQYLEAEEMAQVSTSEVIAEGFSEADTLTLQWPVEGEVLLEFSMDHSIYFPTLAQYQYNPAMIIGSAEGTPVYAAASGIVIDVGKSNEFGHYMTMDIGNGFEITYGQIFDITAEIGEELDAGEQIGLVAYPTRSYSEEGDNLYLKLTQDGVSVDPALYLEN